MIVSVCPNPCLDVYYYTSVLKEDDTNRVENPLISPGGKGVNAARVISKLGGTPHLIAPIGGCIGRCVKELLEDEGVFSIFIDVEGETRVNTILEQKGKGKHILIAAKGISISKSGTEKLKSAMETLNPDFMLLGGSVPPNFPDTFYGEVVKTLSHVKVMVDADGELLKNAVKSGAFAIKPNRFELERLVGRPLIDVADIVEASKEITEAGVEVVITSLGEFGAICTTREGSFRVIPPKVKVVNTVGAGDSLVGGFLYALDRGKSIEEAVKLGVACGTATVMKEGVKLADKRDVEEILPLVKVVRC